MDSRVAFSHPSQPLDECSEGVPDLSIACGKLTTVGEGCLHRWIPMAIEHGYAMTAI
jgi:hypothetical protein